MRLASCFITQDSDLEAHQSPGGREPPVGGDKADSQAPGLRKGESIEADFRILKWIPFLGSGANLFEALIIEYDGVEHSTVFETGGTRIMISDEPFWNPQAAVNDTLSKLVAVANHHGFQAGACITPAAWDYFGGPATAKQLIDQAARSDFVVINPYYMGSIPAEQLLWFSEVAIRIARDLGKEIIVVRQGFALPGTEEAVRAYNAKLALLQYDERVDFDALDFADIPDSWQIELVGLPS